MGNTITTLLKWWFKPTPKQLPPPPPPTTPLPTDVLLEIMTKLDIVTLCRCTAASPPLFSPLLPDIASLSTALPPSFFLPARTTLWYGKSLLWLIRKVNTYVLLGMNTTSSLRRFIFKKLCLTNFCIFVWLHAPRLHPSAKRFFQRLESLDSAELQLPTPSTAEYLCDPHTWFRWNVKLSENSNSHLFFVIADIDSQRGVVSDHQFDPLQELFTKSDIILRHFVFHFVFLAYLPDWSLFHFFTHLFFNIESDSVDDIQTIRSLITKDAGANGKFCLLGHDPSCNEHDISSIKYMVCYVPTTLELRTRGNDSGLQVKNVWLFFLSTEGRFDDDVSAEDVIRTIVDGFGHDDGSMVELREAVLKIVADDNRRLFGNQDFWEHY